MTQQELVLPKGWIFDLLTKIFYHVPTGVKNFDGLKDYYSTGSIKSSKITSEGRFNFEQKPSRANRLAKKNDVFQARMAQSEKSLLVNDDFNENLFSTGFLQFRSLAECSPKYLFYLLNSGIFLTQRDKFSTGSTQKALTDSGLKRIVIPLAPLNEQKRIVSKIEELFSKIDSTKKSLEYTKLQLEFYMDSLLKYAFDRKFSEKYENNSSFFWNDVSVESVLEKRGMFDGPFGSNLKTEHYTNSGVRVARLENIKKLEFDNSKQSFISVARYNALKRHTVFENDILFASFIDSEVRCCIVPRLNDVVINKADCFCIRPDKKQILPKFLMFQLSSKQFFSQIKQKSHGVTRSRINTKQLRSSMIKLCSIEEQEEIVSQIEQGFSLIKNSQRIVNSTLQTLEIMRMSVLKQAFEGKLVPQDPNDESASVLLDRIKKEK